MRVVILVQGSPLERKRGGSSHPSRPASDGLVELWFKDGTLLLECSILLSDGLYNAVYLINDHYQQNAAPYQVHVLIRAHSLPVEILACAPSNA